MKVKFVPKSKPGKLSLELITAMPILFFVGSSLADTLYRSIPAGETIPKDIVQRLALALTMLLGMACGVLAFVVGLVAIISKKERAFVVYVTTLIGMLFSVFLLAEVLFPH